MKRSSDNVDSHDVITVEIGDASTTMHVLIRVKVEPAK